MKGQQHHWKSNHNKCERVADHSVRLLQRDKKEEDNHYHQNNIGTGFEIKMLKYKSNGTIIFGTHTPFVRCWDYKLTNHQILHYVQARKLYHLQIFGIFLWIPYTSPKMIIFLIALFKVKERLFQWSVNIKICWRVENA